MEIRKAGLEDLKEICRMGYQLSLDMSALEPGYFAVAEQKEAPMRQAVLEETKDIFLAETAGKIVGFACVWQCEPKPEENYLVPGKFAYLSDLVLLPESRGMGLEAHCWRPAKTGPGSGAFSA